MKRYTADDISDMWNDSCFDMRREFIDIEEIATRDEFISELIELLTSEVGITKTNQYRQRAGKLKGE